MALASIRLPHVYGARDLMFDQLRQGLPEGVGVGDPEHLIQVIKRWESIGVTGINFLLNAMEMLPQEQVLDSMRLFAREVMPKFRSREDSKAPVWAPSRADAKQAAAC